MKSHRLLTLLSAVSITGLLLTPGLASAHEHRGDWHRSQEARWSSPHQRHERHERHERWHHRRHHDRWDRRYAKHERRTRIYVDDDRRPPRLVYRGGETRLNLGRGVTIIYR